MTIFSKFRKNVEILQSQFKQLEYINNLKITEPFNATIDGFNYIVLYTDTEKKDFVQTSAFNLIKDCQKVTNKILTVDFTLYRITDQQRFKTFSIKINSVVKNCIEIIGGLETYNNLKEQFYEIEDFYNEVNEFYINKVGYKNEYKEYAITTQDNEIHKSIIKAFDSLFIEDENIKTENKISKQDKTKEDYINIAYLIAEREDFTVTKKTNRKGIEDIINQSSYTFNSKSETIAINIYSTINNTGNDKKSLFNKTYFDEIRDLLISKYKSLENIPNKEFSKKIENKLI